MAAPATQALANEQAAEERRRLLAQRLQQQMAARASVQGQTGRIQSVGRPFGNATDLRASAVPLLSLGGDLSANRLRPAGFDASAPATIVPASPISLGPGQQAASSDSSTLPASAAPTPQQQPTSLPRYDNGPPTDSSGFNSDTPLTAPAPLASVTPPDPYTVMVQAITQRLLQQKAAQYAANPNILGRGVVL